MFPYEYVQSITTTLLKLYEKYALGVGLFESPLVYRNRNQLFAQAYKDGVDYILFVDSDMDWSPGDVDKLVALDKDIACGLYYSRKPVDQNRHLPMVMEYVDGQYEIAEVLDKPFLVDACGMAFTLIKRSVIEKMFEEYCEPFNPIISNGDFLGEDISFCDRARNKGFEVWCNPDVKIGHLVTVSMGKE